MMYAEERFYSNAITTKKILVSDYGNCNTQGKRYSWKLELS
jgi:hypothetical protein